MPDERATLRIDGHLFGGWTDVSIRRSLEQAAAAFSFGATTRYPGEVAPLRIRPGAACEVLIGDEVVVRGYVDAVAARLEAGDHALAVGGRSKTADLIDCSAVHTPGRWRNRKVEAIARDLAAPFGVVVNFDPMTTGAALSRFGLESGETVVEAIQRAAALRQLIVTDDAEGRLILTRPGAWYAEVAIEEGVNLLGGTSKADASEVFGTYLCRGQRVGTDDDFGDTVARVTGQASDPDVKRHRVLVVNAEAQVSGAAAKSRAVWEAATRAGRSFEAQVRVQGWRQVPGGPVWTPNRLVQVKAPSLGVGGEFLVAGVDLTLDDSGTVAVLDLALPDAYKAAPLVAAKGGKGGSRAGAGAWREIAAGATVDPWGQVTGNATGMYDTVVPRGTP